jgi:hypothetical protein
MSERAHIAWRARARALVVNFLSSSAVEAIRHSNVLSKDDRWNWKHCFFTKWFMTPPIKNALLFSSLKKQDWKSLQSLPAFTYQFVHKAQNRNVLLIAGKTSNKLPTGLRPEKGCNAACRPTTVRNACNSAGLRPVIKFVTFLQGCRERLPDKAAGQGCMQWCNMLKAWWNWSKMQYSD